MVRFLIQRPVAVIMSTIAFIVLGIVASFRLPVSLMPDIEIPEITIHYTWDNASISEIENTITAGLRNQLQQIPKLTEIQTESKEGSGLITMKFEYGTSLDYAFIEVNQKVDASVNSLPKEVQRPTIIKASTSDLPVFYKHQPEGIRIGRKILGILRVHGCRVEKKTRTTDRHRHGRYQRDVFPGTLYPA